MAGDSPALPSRLLSPDTSAVREASAALQTLLPTSFCMFLVTRSPLVSRLPTFLQCHHLPNSYSAPGAVKLALLDMHLYSSPPMRDVRIYLNRNTQNICVSRYISHRADPDGLLRSNEMPHVKGSATVDRTVVSPEIADSSCFSRYDWLLLLM